MGTDRVQGALSLKEQQLAGMTKSIESQIQRGRIVAADCRTTCARHESTFAAVQHALKKRTTQATTPLGERSYVRAVVHEARAERVRLQEAQVHLEQALQKVTHDETRLAELLGKREVLQGKLEDIERQECIDAELRQDDEVGELAMLTSSVPQPDLSMRLHDGAAPLLAEYRGGGGQGPSATLSPSSTVPAASDTAGRTLRDLPLSHESRVIACTTQDRVGEAKVALVVEASGGGRYAVELSHVGSAPVRIALRAESDIDRRLLIREREQIRATLRERGIAIGAFDIVQGEAV